MSVSTGLSSQLESTSITPVYGGRRLKVIVAKVGLDGHDRGAKVVARALRDAGFEVIYLGVHQTPEDVVNAAIEEDADVIGISILSGSHMELTRDVLKLLKEKKVNIPVIVGGIIPPQDAEELKRMGVFGVCGPGTPLKEVINIYYKAAIEKRKHEGV
ncbi:MAG: methylmalonyl-CoA mutase [Thermoprotei archaeon]|nr:MAG: methylmalonyl-CoA mutase [Thermoprotei archaeon]